MTDRTVLVADDHAPTRAGVIAALAGRGFTVCAEAGTAEAAVRLAREHRPVVCLLDINMPGNGIAAAAAISNELPTTAIVMLTVSRDDDDLFAALRAGASGYLLKDIASDQLPVELERSLAGEAAMSPALVARVVEEFRTRTRPRLVLPSRPRGVELTLREWEVLELLAEGLSTADVATRLFVTPATIRSHVTAILRKLHVRTRREALRLLEQR